MTSSIVDYFHGQNLDIGERDAEAVKISIGSASPTESEQGMEVNGRDSVTGEPKTQKVSSGAIREALKEPVSEIVDAVRKTLMRCEPQLFADLKGSVGIVLSGGGSLLRGLDRLLSKEVGIPVCLADNPMSATVDGVGVVLGEIDYLVKNRKTCCVDRDGNLISRKYRMVVAIIGLAVAALELIFCLLVADKMVLGNADRETDADFEARGFE